MLAPGQPAGMSKEDAVELLEELQRCRSRGRQLLEALRDIATIVDRVLRVLCAPSRGGPSTPSGGQEGPDRRLRREARLPGGEGAH